MRSMEDEPEFEEVGYVVRTERTDEGTTIVWRTNEEPPAELPEDLTVEPPKLPPSA